LQCAEKECRLFKRLERHNNYEAPRGGGFKGGFAVDEVFTTAKFARDRRYAAWQEAICDVYLKVDVASARRDDYEGFIREARLGNVVVTDTLLSQQQITRQNRHIAQLDKDCFYIQLIQQGHISVEQSGRSLLSNSASAAVFCATERYTLQCQGKVRAYYVEVPRDAFEQRFSSGRAPVIASIGANFGMGRIATEFCSNVAANAESLDEAMRAKIGEELIDVLALALECGPERHTLGESAARHARLLSIKAWIEEHLSDPALTLEKVARSNQISVRQLHYLFELCDMTPSDWIWRRRLDRSYEQLARDQTGMSVTEIAFRNGFSSSSHFSTLFRRNFGIRPTEARKGALLQPPTFP
jgi:AraC-like DNA-binding protein